jgi:hypothetical protein
MTAINSGCFLHDDLVELVTDGAATKVTSREVSQQDDEVRLYCAKAGLGLTSDSIGALY